MAVRVYIIRMINTCLMSLSLRINYCHRRKHDQQARLQRGVQAGDANSLSVCETFIIIHYTTD